MSSQDALLWATAVGTGATAVATAGLVWVAVVTLGGAKDQLSLLRQQAVREGRPFIVAEVVPGLHGAGFTDLVVANTGRTIAHNVTIDVGQLTTRDDDDHISEVLHKYLVTPRTLAPGSRHRVMWRMEPTASLPQAGADRSGITGTVSYMDDAGGCYSENYDLSVDSMLDALPVPTDGPKVASSSRTTMETDLANIDRAIRALSLHVGELRR